MSVRANDADRYKRPDLAPRLRASETVGKVLKPGDVVIYESTVYPGATAEDCVPVLKKCSGLEDNRDFHAGYSPERITDSMAGYVADQLVKLMTRRKNCACSLSRPHRMAEVACADIDLNRRGGPPCKN